VRDRRIPATMLPSEQQPSAVLGEIALGNDRKQSHGEHDSKQQVSTSSDGRAFLSEAS
jgi:hypothetical protein